MLHIAVWTFTRYGGKKKKKSIVLRAKVKAI